jgi:peptide/nickel transport system substrate-binding protein
MKLHTLRVLAALAVPVLGVAACGAAHAANNSSGGTSTVFTQPVAPEISADPVDSTTIDNMLVIRAAYDGLVNEVTGTYSVEPALATKWTESDNEIWTFTLRKGVKFADGTPFNTAAVVANFKRYKQLGGQVGGLFSDVASITTPEASTVVFTLSSPDTGFLNHLAWASIVSPTAFTTHVTNNDYGAAWLSANTDGTGPYQTAGPISSGQGVLVQNKHYWGGWQPNQVTKINLTPAPDASTQLELLQKGQIDTTINVPLAPYLKQLKANKSLTVEQAPSTHIDEVQFNTQSGPTKNLLVREAITDAYNYNAGIQAAYDGSGIIPRGALPPGFPGFDNSIQPYKQDLAKARQLLQQAGETNLTLSLWWDAADDPLYEKSESLVLQSSLAQIGVKVVITGSSFAQMSKAASSPATAPDMNFLWHGAITGDPVESLGDYFASQYIGGFNWSFFNSKTFDNLLTQASAAPTTADRNSDLAQAQQVVAQQEPALFTAIPNTIEAINSHFTGFVIHPLDYGQLINYYALRVKG